MGLFPRPCGQNTLSRPAPLKSFRFKGFRELKSLLKRLFKPKPPSEFSLCPKPRSGSRSKPWPAAPLRSPLEARSGLRFPAGQAGFSIVGVVTASAIGLIVIMGTTQSFVQQRVSFLALEKRMSRLEANRRAEDGQQRFMGKDWDCLKTLEKKKLSGSAGDAKRSFEIAAVKDSAAPAPNTVWDFAKNSSGGLTASATKQGLESHGIDKFEGLEFVYEPAKSPAAGRIVLSSKTNIPGLLEGKNTDIVWELSGINVETKTAAEARAEGLTAGAGDYVTACGGAAPAAPAEEPCGAGAAGAPHSKGGGFVEATAKANVAATAFIGPDAAVCDTAEVRGYARVLGHAKVYERAQVYGSARISGHAKVYGAAKVYGSARVYENADVSGNAKVYGDAEVYNDARVYGFAEVLETARVYGEARVYDNGSSHGNVAVSGNARVYENSDVYGSGHGGAHIKGNARVYGEAKVYSNTTAWWATVQDNAQVYGEAEVFGSAVVYGNAKVHGDARIETYVHIGGDSRLCRGSHDGSGGRDDNVQSGC